MIKKFSVLALTGLVSACVTLDPGSNGFKAGLDTMPGMYCTTDNTAAKTADWKAATVIEESVKDNLFESGLMTMWQNKPYIIRLTNNDDGIRTFRAPGFLRDAAILKAVYDNKTVEAPCLNAVAMAPGKTAELYVVPLEKGGYDYHETVFWVPYWGEVLTSADVGTIYVR